MNAPKLATVTPPRVLVVEDDMMIAMMLQDSLTMLGYEVVGPVSRVESAVHLAERETMDAALLDINLAGEKVDRVAERLTLRRIPFAFVSGYGASWVPKAFVDRPRIEKPFQVKDLQRVLAGMLTM